VGVELAHQKQQAAVVVVAQVVILQVGLMYLTP